MGEEQGRSREPTGPVPEPDLERPNPARMYDYMLGGAQNFAADRELAERILTVYPQAREVAVANRRFLGRAVTACLDAGVRQFLDLGSGVPTVGNVHEIAQARDPGARVAYVDIEPVAVTHARSLLGSLPGVSVTSVDLRYPDVVLDAPGVAGLLDFEQPVALLMVAVLHFVPPSEDLPAIVARYRRALAPGSMTVCSHGSTDFDDPAAAESARLLAELTRDSAQPAYPRDRAELAATVAGFALLEPGMVDVSQWRPDGGEDHFHPTGVYGFVGRLG